MVSTLTTQIRTMLRNAEADLMAAAGDASLCVLARSGQSYPAVKYHEGRVAVLFALLRTETEHDLIEAIAQQRHRLLSLAGLAERNEEWRGYVQGGLDTLDRVEAVV